ncbi:hypothetical protein HAZT_HAZT008285 [Hyalella azteca]|uniref:Ig-like domain-containing protein n=1 Tax=Hyalella azteca TaxID=294128 RepID=A0A6A0HAN3_HYAAZ|nr:hypothetical protein HAZT_HAZT008285 [Hyalella azteca]
MHQAGTEHWDLVVSSVTFRDAGVYECQVSTSPKASLPITLHVLGGWGVLGVCGVWDVQEAQIAGPSELYIQTGSTISVSCSVAAGADIVGNIRWQHGVLTLNYSSPRGGISMEVEKTPYRTLSKLHITRAQGPDSGNYTCAPENARPATVLVHVVKGGHFNYSNIR